VNGSICVTFLSSETPKAFECQLSFFPLLGTAGLEQLAAPFPNPSLVGLLRGLCQRSCAVKQAVNTKGSCLQDKAGVAFCCQCSQMPGLPQAAQQPPPPCPVFLLTEGGWVFATKATSWPRGSRSAWHRPGGLG
jgi:hypothetical protein